MKLKVQDILTPRKSYHFCIMDLQKVTIEINNGY